MGLRLIIKAISLLLILAHVAEGANFDVTKYGAKANAYIKQALTSAWKEACAVTSPSTVTIPAGTYHFSILFKEAIDEMAKKSLRCVAIAYRSYEKDKVPDGEEQLAQWVLPEADLVLLAIVGIKDPYRPGEMH